MPSDRITAPGPRPTLRTIAEKAGLAVTTVSRALNDAPDIGEATKARVRGIAEQIGYYPDRAALRLRTGRTNVISLVMPSEQGFMNHPGRLISSIAAGLRGTSYHLIVTPYFPDQDPLAPIRYLAETRSADGVIFNQVRPRDPRVGYLLERGIAVGTHGRSELGGHAWYDFDNAAFACLAVRAMAGRGRRHIVAIAPPATQSYGQAIRDGAARAVQSLGGEIGVEVLTGADSHSDGEDIAAALGARLGTAPNVDGVICMSTSGAMAAISAIEAAGLTIGRQIDLVGKEAMPFLHLLRPGILWVREDVGAAGSFLARAVMASIADPSAPPRHHLDVPERIEGVDQSAAEPGPPA